MMKKLLVLLTAAAMVCAFAASASASEFSFYGNLRIFTYSAETSSEVNRVEHKETNGSGAGIVSPTNPVAFNESDRDLSISFSPYSRFGANIAISDDLSGLIEVGLDSAGANVSFRRLFGEYDFGAGKLLIGHDWHPAGVNVGYSNQIGMGDDDALGSVGIAASRSPQVRLTFGDFGLYFISPDHDALTGIGDSRSAEVTVDSGGSPEVGEASPTPNTYYDDDVSWPHIAAVYNLKYENFSFGILGAFQTYEVSDTRGEYEFNDANDSGGSLDVDSHLLKLGVKGEFDAFTVGISYGFGQNIANMGLVGGINASFDAMNGKILDVDTTAYTIVGGFKVNDMLNLEAGYGKISNDIDGAAKDDETSAYYLQAAITVTDGFVITPEIGKYDYEENSAGADEGDATYFGAKWQINF